MRLFLSAALLLTACSVSVSGTARVATTTTPSEAPARAAAPAALSPEAQALLAQYTEQSSGEIPRVDIHANDPGNHPSHGPADAPVTLAIFSDFQCPFCARMTRVVGDLRAEYGDQLQIRWYNMPLGFHDQAVPAAVYALEAQRQQGDAGFWAAHDAIFANQRELSQGLFVRLAQEQGLDVEEVRQALAGDRHHAAIRRDLVLATSLGIRGTPASFVNGRPISGAQPSLVFAELIDDELERAAALEATGVAPAQLSAELTGTGVAQVAPRRRRRRVRRQMDTSVRYQVPVAESAPRRGPDDALVTLVVFSDFECPFCMRLAPTLEALAQRYGEDLRIVWQNNPLPFHDNALPAAEIALEARRQLGDAGFWRMHDRIFQSSDKSPESLEALAAELGLDAVQLRSALENETHQPQIRQEQALAQRIGARGTPASFVNGHNLSGAQPLERFIELIDAELAEARSLQESGVPRSEVYERLMQDASPEVRYLDE